MRIPVTTLEQAEAAFSAGHMNMDDWQEFVDGLCGYGGDWPGYVEVPDES